MLPRVYLASVGTQAGPITDRPRTDLTAMCLEAAQEAFACRDLGVDAIYLGTMGVHRGRDPDALDVSHIPALVKQRLAPGARGLQVLTSTSESGAQVFSRAVADLRAGSIRRALVLAGEQMFTPPTAQGQSRLDRKVEAQANATIIRGVVDPRERSAYGLTMLQIGDLLMDHLAALAGLDEPQCRDLLAHVAIDKSRRAQAWPRSFAAGKGRPLDADQYADVAHNPPISHWYRRQDVVANACGATAVLLTTQAEDLPPGPRLAVLGIGHGEVEVALRDRTGPFGAPAAIAQALAQVTREAGLPPERIRSHPRTVGVLHDAFPAIELLFLHALAGQQGWPWALQAFRDGWGHPLGGLAACGHALGNSGLLQIAQAFALVHGDRRLLDRDAVPDLPRPRAVLTSSVGSALTRVVMTLLADVSDPDFAEPLPPGDTPVVSRASLPPPGTVLACTRPLPGTDGWVHAVQQDGQRVALALHDARLAVGTPVQLAGQGDPLRIVPLP